MYQTTILKGRVEHQKIAQISVVLMNDQSWIKRTGEEHKQLSRMLQLAKTAIERKEIEKEHGARYSELFRLPYFDPIRFHCVDPMHNLVLGTAKKTIASWIETGIITEIDDRMSRFKLPSDMTRIPNGISK